DGDARRPAAHVGLPPLPHRRRGHVAAAVAPAAPHRAATVPGRRSRAAVRHGGRRAVVGDGTGLRAPACFRRGGCPPALAAGTGFFAGGGGGGLVAAAAVGGEAADGA